MPLTAVTDTLSDDGRRRPVLVALNREPHTLPTHSDELTSRVKGSPKKEAVEVMVTV